MCPRPYRSDRRQEAKEQTRARIIAAARELLGGSSGLLGFTVDAIAQQAGVARMTVYYQFKSKGGLLEALFDDLAARGLVQRLLPALRQAEPLDALSGLIAAFGAFWASDRLVIRRIRALAAFDPDVEQSLRRRDERRRELLRAILTRLGEGGQFAAVAVDETADLLHTLTSFETFDQLAGANRQPDDVVPVVQRISWAALGLDHSSTGNTPPKPRRRSSGKPRAS
jgi:AcrR family transcriptional regulator